MDSTEPSPPVAMRLFSQARATLTPSYTLVYLTLEAAAIATTCASLSLILGLPALLCLLVSATVLLPVGARAVTTPSDAYRSEHAFLPHSLLHTALVTLLQLTLVAGAALILQLSITQTTVAAFPAVAYTVTLHKRSHPYRGERSYFIPEHDPNSEAWVYASVALEQATAQTAPTHEYRAYYHSQQAREQYEALAKTTPRPVHQAVAEQLATAATALSHAQLVHQQHTDKYQTQYTKAIETANELLSYRVCDDCHTRVSVDSCVRVADTPASPDTHETLYCKACYQEMNATANSTESQTHSSENTHAHEQAETRQTGSQTRASTANTQAETNAHTASQSRQATQEQATRETRATNSETRRRAASDHDTDTRTRKTHTSQSATAESATANTKSGAETENSSDSTSSNTDSASTSTTSRTQQEIMSRGDALAILELSPPVTDDEIRAAYRDQVKTKHPDSGGTTAEFIELKKAYDRLS